MGSSQADNASPSTRQLIMKKLTVNQLQATTFVNVTVSSLLNCQMLCLAVDTCAFVTFSQLTNMCRLYSTANTCNPTTVNVAGLQVYASDSKHIAVRINLNLLNRAT